MRRDFAFSFLLVAFMLVAVVAVNEVSAQTTTIALNPSTVKDVPVGQTFTMDVTISGASNIYGWQVNMTFNHDVLSVDGVAEGSFLKNVNATIWPIPKIDNDKGQVMFSSSFNVPYPSAGASGAGVLATITFKVKSGGGSVLDFVDGTKLRTIEAGHLMPIENFVSQDGTFGTPAGSGFGIPLEILAVVGIVVVVAVAGGVFYLRKRRQ